MKSAEKRVRCRCGRSEYVLLRTDEPKRLERAMRSRRWGWADKRRACPRCLRQAAQPTDALRTAALAAEREWCALACEARAEAEGRGSTGEAVALCCAAAIRRGGEG